MDINTLRGIATIVVMTAFIGICWWAFTPKNRQKFKDAANLPFKEDDASNDEK